MRPERRARAARQGRLEPVRVQRRASNTGVVIVCGQKIALGRTHRHQTITIAVSDTTLAIDLGDGDTTIVRRTTSTPVRSIKGPAATDRYLNVLDHMSHLNRQTCVAHQPTDHIRRVS